MDMTRDEIVARLRDEALDQQHVGWLSDMPEAEYNDRDQAIEILESGWPIGSIDLSQLAGVVEDIIRDYTR